MATSILSVDNTEGSTSSGTIDVQAGTPVTLTLTGPGGGLDPSSKVLIQKQDSGSNWSSIETLSFGRPIGVLHGTGTYRVFRVSGTCGVDQD